MKSILFFALGVLTLSFMNNQTDNWKVFHNKNLLLSASEESEEKNRVTLSKAELSQTGVLALSYTGAALDTGWKRSFMIIDESGNILGEKESYYGFKLKNADLKKLFGKGSILKIYTWAIPKDPAKAALVRVRRVHLCTVVLK
jgi:hypothetical protein